MLRRRIILKMDYGDAGEMQKNKIVTIQGLREGMVMYWCDCYSYVFGTVTVMYWCDCYTRLFVIVI